MNRIFIIGTIVATSIMAAGFAGVGAVSVVKPIVAPPSINMTLDFLRFKDGYFRQMHTVKGTRRLSAKWTAQIFRGKTPICQGGGNGIYETSDEKVMKPNIWTGGKCPQLLKGDRAIAVWEYTSGDGLVHIVSGVRIIE